VIQDIPDDHMHVRKDTGEIVAIGYLPTAPADDNIYTYAVADHQREALATPGAKYLLEDGTIEVVAPEETTEVEQPDYGMYGESDNTTVIQAVTGIVQYIANSDPTPKETTTAVKHMGRLLLYLAARWLRLV
jgi:hypothetical protein